MKTRVNSGKSPTHPKRTRRQQRALNTITKRINLWSGEIDKIKLDAPYRLAPGATLADCERKLKRALDEEAILKRKLHIA